MTAQLTVHRLQVPGATLHYEVRGSGPVLLVVGQPMTSEPFAALADRLAADRTVVTYDPRGLGRSSVDDPSQPITPEIEGDDLSRIITALDAGPADVVGSSGGAVAALALAVQRPDQVRTLVAHEPPVTALLPDARQIAAVVDDIELTYRGHGAGAAWGSFVSLVMHQGPVTDAGVAPATWTPPAPDDAPDGAGAAPAPELSAQEQAKRDADDALFFLRMLKPFTRFVPDADRLRTGGVRVLVAVGAASGDEVAKRSALALAELLAEPALVFPGHHGGFVDDPDGFAAAVRQALTR